MNETIEYGDWIECGYRDVVAAGSPFLHGLLHAYQSHTTSSDVSRMILSHIAKITVKVQCQEKLHFKIKTF